MKKKRIIKKYQSWESFIFQQLIKNFAGYRWNISAFLNIVHLKILSGRKVHISTIGCEKSQIFLIFSELIVLTSI